MCFFANVSHCGRAAEWCSAITEARPHLYFDLCAGIFCLSQAFVHVYLVFGVVFCCLLQAFAHEHLAANLFFRECLAFGVTEMAREGGRADFVSLCN